MGPTLGRHPRTAFWRRGAGWRGGFLAGDMGRPGASNGGSKSCGETQGWGWGQALRFVRAGAGRWLRGLELRIGAGTAERWRGETREIFSARGGATGAAG